MNFCLFIICVLVTLQCSLCSNEKKILEKKIVEELIVSPDLGPDSTNDTSHVKEEVENIREAINGQIPIPTFLQLHDTSDVRSKIKDAIAQGKYAKGTPVPEDINVRLHANKEESSLPNILDVASVQEEVTDDEGKFEEIGIVDLDTSTKKDLSNPKDPNYKNWFRPSPWIKHRLYFRDNHEKPLVLRDPNIHTVLQLPIWFKLRRGFVSNLFASMKN